MPEWVIHALTGIGFLGLIAGFIFGIVPFIKKYSIPKMMNTFYLNAN